MKENKSLTIILAVLVVINIGIAAILGLKLVPALDVCNCPNYPACTKYNVTNYTESLISLMTWTNTTQDLNITLAADHSNVKLICDQNNICRDYDIECYGNIIVGIYPTTLPIYNPANWTDTRSQDWIKYKWC